LQSNSNAAQDTQSSVNLLNEDPWDDEPMQAIQGGGNDFLDFNDIAESDHSAEAGHQNLSQESQLQNLIMKSIRQQKSNV